MSSIEATRYNTDTFCKFKGKSLHMSQRSMRFSTHYGSRIIKLTCSSTFREPATGLSCLPLFVGSRLYVKVKHVAYHCMRIFYAVL